jgi:hypothetical protein
MNQDALEDRWMPASKPVPQRDIQSVFLFAEEAADGLVTSEQDLDHNKVRVLNFRVLHTNGIM